MAAISARFDDFCPLDKKNPIENKMAIRNEPYYIIKIRFNDNFFSVSPLIIRYIPGTMLFVRAAIF